MSDLTLTIKLTDAGMAAVAAAHGQGIQAKITHVAVGDQGYAPAADAVALHNELARVALTAGGAIAPQQVLLQGMIPAGGQEFFIRELGYYLEDGTLLGVWSDPATPLGWLGGATPWFFKLAFAWTSLPADAITVLIADDAGQAGMALDLAQLDGKVRHTVETAEIVWSGDDNTQLTEAIRALIASAATKGLLAAVRLCATAPIALAGLDVIDGMVPVAGDRVLVAGQVDHVVNGVYIAAAGAWERATDAAIGAILPAGTVVPVLAGTQHGDSVWMLTNDIQVEIGTAATAWQRVGGDGLPLGSLIMHSGPAAPAGYLIANGAAVARATYAELDAVMYVGDVANATAPAYYRCTDAGNPTGTRATGGAYLVLPDYRGVTLRGLDLGRGLDPDGATRVVNSYQADAYGSHKHSLRQTAGGGNLDVNASGTSYDYRYTDVGSVNYNESTMLSGAAETRGKNAAVTICIKAFSASTNQGLIDITELANEVAGKLAGTALGLGLADPSGYLPIPYRDVVTGEIKHLIWQWGKTTLGALETNVTVTLPMAMPTGFLQAYASVSTDSTVWLDASTARAGANGASLTTILVGMDKSNSGATSNIVSWQMLCR